MKKILTACLMALMVLPVVASDYVYKYLVLTTTGGEQTTVATENLRITFADGKLVASNDDGSMEVTLASLSKMFFSEKGTESTGVSTVDSRVSDNAACEVYALSGLHMGSYQSLSEARSRLAHGIYVVKQSGKNIKITVK